MSTTAGDGCFASILQNSLTRETATKANCTKCGRLTTFFSRRRYGSLDREEEARRLPSILSINASIISDDHLEVWRDTPLSRSKHGRKRFLPDSVRVRLGEEGDVRVYDDNDGSPNETTDIRYIVRVRQRQEISSKGFVHSLISCHNAGVCGFHTRTRVGRSPSRCFCQRSVDGVASTYYRSRS